MVSATARWIGCSVIGLGLLAGCALQSTASAPLMVDNKTAVEPTLEVGDGISGRATNVNILFFLNFGCYKQADGVDFTGNEWRPFSGVLERVKGAAAYDAIQKTNADVLVDPRYLIEDYNFLIFRVTKGTVQARQGTIKGYKQVTAGGLPQPQ